MSAEVPDIRVRDEMRERASSVLFSTGLSLLASRAIYEIDFYPEHRPRALMTLSPDTFRHVARDDTRVLDVEVSPTMSTDEQMWVTMRMLNRGKLSALPKVLSATNEEGVSRHDRRVLEEGAVTIPYDRRILRGRAIDWGVESLEHLLRHRTIIK